MKFAVLVVMAGAVSGLAAQTKPFTYAGVGLTTDVKTIARRYPHSDVDGAYLRVAPQDSHDHIGGFEVSAQRVRVWFAMPLAGREEYPPCAQVEKQLVKDFGQPASIRKFNEEATVRADRHWESPAEAMTLICFVGPRRTLLAEAVVISRR